MPQLPTGTVTFLFTDIEGSTRLLGQLRERYTEVLTEHRRLLRDAFAQAGGQEIDTQGDAFFVAFARARDALLAAVSAQRALHSHRWPGGTAVQVRMGMHTGEPLATDPEYVGMDVHRAARISQAGHGGQILLSQTTRDLIDDEVPEGITLRDMGVHRLKDLSNPQRIFQVVVADLPSEFPLLKSLDVSPNNLPRQLTSFIGREQEMTAVKRLLSSARQVTLTGAGGSGKTRLALQVAAGLLEDYADGVWWVELAPLVDQNLVPHAVASALGLREQPGRLLTETLRDFLRQKKLLVTLDNCEHMLHACAQLADTLLQGCPELKILATSREGLSFAGEMLYPVPPLSVPDPERLPPLEQLSEYEAVRLFAARAGAVMPDFRITDQTARGVAQLCARLDGIPLAIELAAARVRALSVEQIVARLDDRFRLLTGGSRTALPRHRTLQAALDWSYDLLSAEERILFQRLSVFVGEFTLEATEAVCAGDSIAREEVVDLLTRLVEKSMVLAEPQDGEVRYRLLETVRQYGLNKLLQAGEVDTIREMHSDFYMSVALEAEPHLRLQEQAAWFSRLDREYDNLRTALGWTLEKLDEKGLQLAAVLWEYWSMRGHLVEGRQWLDRATQAKRQVPTTLRIKVLTGAGMLAFHQDEFGRAVDLLAEAAALAQGAEEPRQRAFALAAQGHAAWHQGTRSIASPLCAEGVALARKGGDPWTLAYALSQLGIVAAHENERERATVALQEALALFRELGDTRSIALCLFYLGVQAEMQEEYREATAVFEECLALQRKIGDKSGMALTLGEMGSVALTVGRHDRASELLGEAITLSHELGNPRMADEARIDAGVVALAQGNLTGATAFFEDVLASGKVLADNILIANALNWLGMAAFYMRDHSRARKHLKESLATIGGEYPRTRATILRNLGIVTRAQGAYGDAESALRESLTLRWQQRSRLGAAECLEEFAALALSQEKPERAARLLGAAHTMREPTGATMTPGERITYERALASLRGTLGEESFAAAWTKGQAMTLEQAIEYALGER